MITDVSVEKNKKRQNIIVYETDGKKLPTTSWLPYSELDSEILGISVWVKKRIIGKNFDRVGVRTQNSRYDV